MRLRSSCSEAPPILIFTTEYPCRDSVASPLVILTVLFQGNNIRRPHRQKTFGSANSSSETIRKNAVQRHAGDLRHCIPYRHIDNADCYRPLAVSTRFLIPHENVPYLKRIEITAGVIQEVLWVRSFQPRDKAVT